MQTQQSQSAQIQSSPAKASVFDGYSPPANTYDELLDSGGVRRGPWSRFCEAVDRIGSDELERRWSNARRFIHENGVAFGAYGDPLDKPRPWELDPLPLVLSEGEWNQVAAGLRQRATLLNLTLKDLYGPRDLIRTGVLPRGIALCASRVFYGAPWIETGFGPVPALLCGRFGPRRRWLLVADRGSK